MSFLREFHYSSISQRKIISANNFITFVLIGLLFAYISLMLKYYFFYYPVIKVVTIFGFGGIFSGNILGRFLYSRKENFKPVYVTSELVVAILTIFYMICIFLKPAGFGPVIILFFLFKYAIPAMIFITSLFIGIKINYSIRVSCGDFIDKKRGMERFLVLTLSGLATGVTSAGLLYSFDIPLLVFMPLPILLVILGLIVNLPYDPAPLYTRDDEEDRSQGGAADEGRGTNHIVFSYLNFVYLIVYSYLGYACVSKYYGDLIYVKLIFMVTIFIVMLAGYGAGRYIKILYTHIYGESFLPVAFLSFLIMLMSFNQVLHFFPAILFFHPRLFFWAYYCITR